jgi:hypothetical protein
VGIVNAGRRELTVPNPTDRYKPSNKCDVMVASNGLSLGAVASAANVNDTRMFPELLRLALLVGVPITRGFNQVGNSSGAVSDQVAVTYTATKLAI